jgi:hypothetical protein
VSQRKQQWDIHQWIMCRAQVENEHLVCLGSAGVANIEQIIMASLKFVEVRIVQTQRLFMVPYGKSFVTQFRSVTSRAVAAMLKDNLNVIVHKTRCCLGSN